MSSLKVSVVPQTPLKTSMVYIFVEQTTVRLYTN